MGGLIGVRVEKTVANEAAQVVLMEDDLSQLKLYGSWQWELAEGFEASLSINARQAGRMSLLAATGVLLLPFGPQLGRGGELIIGPHDSHPNPFGRRSRSRSKRSEKQIAEIEQSKDRDQNNQSQGSKMPISATT
jgi:hypothetical protein